MTNDSLPQVPVFSLTDFWWASIDYLVQHPFDTLLVVFASAIICYLLISLILDEARQRLARAEVQRIVDEMEHEEALKARERGLAAIMAREKR